VVEVLGGPRTVWLMYWLDPGLCGWSNSWTHDCVIEVLVGPRTVWLMYWLGTGLCG